MRLEGKIVVLKELEPRREGNILLVWRNKERVRRNMYTSHEISPEEHERWLSSIGNDAAKQYFVACDKQTETPIGLVSLYDIDHENLRASWAFYIGEDDYLNKGHAIEMEYLILCHVFDGLGFNRLSCEVLEFNTQVISFHRKFGFVEEGRKRQFIKRQDGWVDAVALSILDTEFRSSRDRIEKFVARIGGA